MHWRLEIGFSVILSPHSYGLRIATCEFFDVGHRGGFLEGLVRVLLRGKVGMEGLEVASL